MRLISQGVPNGTRKYLRYFFYQRNVRTGQKTKKASGTDASLVAIGAKTDF